MSLSVAKALGRARTVSTADEFATTRNVVIQC